MGTAPVGRHGAAGLVGILGCARDVGVTRSVVGGGNGEGHTMKGLEIMPKDDLVPLHRGCAGHRLIASQL